jgi:DNA adenine methylase
MAATSAGKVARSSRSKGRDKPYPFLKWAGGKRQIVPDILARLPQKVGTFHEPFVGGGAVFFALRPENAVLSDCNERLIRTYRGIKHSVDEVIERLDACRNEKEFYLETRSHPVDAGTDAEVAAWMIFLNKTGFNGLYRVNSKNQFNVPYGDNAQRFYDPENLRACSKALAKTRLECEDFSAVFERAKPGDVVYFDPPYVPLSVTSYFTSYTSVGFEMEDQIRLRDLARKLKSKGVYVLLSNSSAPAVRELYGEGFRCEPVYVSRMVNSDPEGRGKIAELLIE